MKWRKSSTCPGLRGNFQYFYSSSTAEETVMEPWQQVVHNGAWRIHIDLGDENTTHCSWVYGALMLRPIGIEYRQEEKNCPPCSHGNTTCTTTSLKVLGFFSFAAFLWSLSKLEQSTGLGGPQTHSALCSSPWTATTNRKITKRDGKEQDITGRSWNATHNTV